MAKRAMQVFSTCDDFPGQRIGLPLRRSAVGPADHARARQSLGLDPNREMLLVTGGSQGAQSINRLMVQLVDKPRVQAAMKNWQVLHLAGDRAVKDGDEAALRAAYSRSGVPATIQAFCDQMGSAWSAATVAISRAGAGSVAEAWANATPTIFLPYPYHKDQHQKLNAQELVNLNGAMLFDDRVEPAANVQQIEEPLIGLMADFSRRQDMIRVMQDHRAGDGADAIADWLTGRLSSVA